MKVAIYNRGKKLAVREQASADAPMVDTLENGTAVEVEEAGAGWLKCCVGYIRADLVVMGEIYDGTKENQTKEVLTEEEQTKEEPKPEQEEPAGEEQTKDDNAILEAMSLNDLRKLAKGSGITLPKNSTKAQVIELLMGNDE